MTIKYQIFVSSTYEDLKEECAQVIKAILEMGHIPVGMELFSAADEEQWKLITRHIDESDYYVVIVAHRYGSITEDGISYTEKEYDYAAGQQIPVIGFLIDEAAKWPANRIDKGAEEKRKLDSLRDKIRRKYITYWEKKDDLYGKVAIALSKAFTTTPRDGWVRPSAVAGPEVTKELSRLSSENAGLRSNLAAARQKEEEERKLYHERTIATLEKNEIEVPIRFLGEADFEERNRQESSLYTLFSTMGPELLDECSTVQIAKIFAMIVSRTKNLSSTWPVPSNYLNGWISDLECLGLVMTSPKKHGVKDTNSYWTLTGEGRDVHRAIRLRRLQTAQTSPTLEAPTANSVETPRKAAPQKRKNAKRTKKGKRT